MMRSIADKRLLDALDTLAKEYDAFAARLEQGQVPDEVEDAERKTRGSA
jgi:hypothetical protein